MRFFLTENAQLPAERFVPPARELQQERHLGALTHTLPRLVEHSPALITAQRTLTAMTAAKDWSSTRALATDKDRYYHLIHRLLLMT